MINLSPELQQEFGLPALLCADPEGLPFPEGQAFYTWLIHENACQPETAKTYLRAVLPFFTFLWFGSPSLRYIAPADHIRNQVRAYLHQKLGCAVRPHPQGNFLVLSSPTVTAQSVRAYLVALRRFYQCAIMKGWYGEGNPLVWAEGVARTAGAFTPGPPPASGLSLPEPKPGRMPQTYFCFRAGEWQPQIIDDPHFATRLLAGFVQPRDRLIARLLLESGARVGEVLRLTLGDWRRLGLQQRATATNKGSHGERVKELWWSSESSQLLRHYMETERRQCDRTGQGLDQLPDAAPLFLTAAGGAYSYFAFYYQWRQACARAGLRAHPHQIRHWFVTMALRRIQAVTETPQREAYRQALITYLHWQNPETIRAYDHHLHLLEFTPIHSALIQLIEGSATEPSPLPGEPQPPRRGETIAAGQWERLNQLLDDPVEGR